MQFRYWGLCVQDLRLIGIWNLKALKVIYIWNISIPLICWLDILVYYKKSIGKVDWVVVKELASISELVKKKDNIDLVK